VASRREPSENVARAVIRVSSAGSTSTCSPGVTSSFTRLGTLAASFAAPSAIHRRSAWYSGDSFPNRRPPSCGTCPVAFRRIRLWSGSIGSVRRANASRVSTSKSMSGSCPRNDSLNPALPLLFP
jgi:hypothetical protein